ncbi:MAG: FAD-dependent oxidoreductase [Gammaproteobacteria bacterium]|nr:FAD-dependent oxidoreductase [Gammaproteobacteria bacterium]
MTKVAVLGGGIVGVCSALALAESGVNVCLIDANKPGQGASRGNAGVVSPWSVVPQSTPGLWKKIPGWLLKEDGPVSVRPAYSPRLLPWAIRFFKQGKLSRVYEIADAMSAINASNVDLYKHLLGSLGHAKLIQDSHYVHGFRSVNGASLKTLDYEIRRQKNADLELIDAETLSRLEPDLSPEFRSAVLIKGQARILSPGRVCEVLVERFQSLGGEVRQSRIDSLTPGDSNAGLWEVQTSQGSISADQVVIALGVWSGNLLKKLGVSVSLEAEHGYHVEFPEPSVQLNHSVMDMDLKMVASSMEGGLRVAGTAEFSGLDYPMTEKRLVSLIHGARKMIPGLRDIEPNVWMGTRPSMPDSLPCIGSIPGHNGLIAAFGHSHFGLMMAPRTAEIVKSLVLGQSVDIDLNPFRIDRF